MLKHFFREVLVVAFSLWSHMKLLAIPTRIRLNENGPLYCSQVLLSYLIQQQARGPLVLERQPLSDTFSTFSGFDCVSLIYDLDFNFSFQTNLWRSRNQHELSSTWCSSSSEVPANLIILPVHVLSKCYCGIHLISGLVWSYVWFAGLWLTAHIVTREYLW